VDRLKDTEKKFRKGGMAKDAYLKAMHERHSVLWEYSDFIKDRNISSIQITGDGVVFEAGNGVKILCDPDDRRSAPLEILNFGDYDSEELKVIRGLLRGDSVIVDIGANIGWYSLTLAKEAQKGKVLALEPVPLIFGYLEKNIGLNKAKNIEPLNLGLSDKAGEAVFFYNPSLPTATSMRKLHDAGESRKIKCKMTTLDTLAAEKALSRIDFIKCDVEGSELLVIRGGLETIKKHKPVLFLEMLRKWSAKFNYHPDDLIKLLADVGYRCFYAEQGKLVEIKKITEDTAATNFYFINR